MPRLTMTRIKAATAPAGKRLHLWCSDLPGFGCRVTPAGASTFICRYRNAAGADRIYTIGSAGRLPVDVARDQARQVFAAVARGGDPAAARAAGRAAPTMQAVFERWQAELAPKRRPATAAAYAGAWARYIGPRWAARQAASITLADVSRLHAELLATPCMANRVLAFCSVLLNAAERWGMRPLNSNPCGHVERYQERARGMVPEPAQLPALWAAIDALRARGGRQAQQAAGYFALLLLTGCRRNELRLALRADVRRERGVLVLRGTKTSGAGEELVELPAEALAEIDALPADPFNPYLFPGAAAGRPMATPYRTWQAVAAAAGLPCMRLHDLRHTVGTYAHEAGASQRAVAQLLRHRQLSTTERYTHGMDTGRRAAASATVRALRPPVA